MSLPLLLSSSSFPPLSPSPSSPPPSPPSHGIKAIIFDFGSTLKFKLREDAVLKNDNVSSLNTPSYDMCEWIINNWKEEFPPLPTTPPIIQGISSDSQENNKNNQIGNMKIIREDLSTTATTSAISTATANTSNVNASSSSSSSATLSLTESLSSLFSHHHSLWKSHKHLNSSSGFLHEKTSDSLLLHSLQVFTSSSSSSPSSSSPPYLFPSSFLSSALTILYKKEMLTSQLYPHCHAVLSYLKYNLGIRLSLISNSANTTKQLSLIHHLHLTDYFDCTVISSHVGYRKPDSRIFRLLLEGEWKKYNFNVNNIMMVGDMLNRDVLGGQRMGFVTVWAKLDEQVGVREIVKGGGGDEEEEEEEMGEGKGKKGKKGKEKKVINNNNNTKDIQDECIESPLSPSSPSSYSFTPSHLRSSSSSPTLSSLPLTYSQTKSHHRNSPLESSIIPDASITSLADLIPLVEKYNHGDNHRGGEKNGNGRGKEDKKEGDIIVDENQNSKNNSADVTSSDKVILNNNITPLSIPYPLPTRRYRIGILMNDKKSKTLSSSPFMDFSHREDLLLIPLTFASLPLSPPYHCKEGVLDTILVKITDAQCGIKYENDEKSAENMRKFDLFVASQGKGCKVIEDMKRVEKLIDRQDMYEKLNNDLSLKYEEEVKMLGITSYPSLCIPKYITIKINITPSLLSLLSTPISLPPPPSSPPSLFSHYLPSDLPFPPFPSILKYRQSCGSSRSHHMKIIYSPHIDIRHLIEYHDIVHLYDKGVRSVDFVLMEMISHKGGIVKGYGCGGDYWWSSQKSIPERWQSRGMGGGGGEKEKNTKIPSKDSGDNSINIINPAENTSPSSLSSSSSPLPSYDLDHDHVHHSHVITFNSQKMEMEMKSLSHSNGKGQGPGKEYMIRLKSNGEMGETESVLPDHSPLLASSASSYIDVSLAVPAVPSSVLSHPSSSLPIPSSSSATIDDSLRPLLNQFVPLIGKVLQGIFQLKLLGFDIIVRRKVSREASEQTGNGQDHGFSPNGIEMFLIDVNYFPSYKGVEAEKVTTAMTKVMLTPNNEGNEKNNNIDEDVNLHWNPLLMARRKKKEEK